MPNFNKVLLIGHLTRDPELKYTGSGTALAKCGIATSRKYKDKEEVCFVDLTVWGDDAERFNSWLKKGSAVHIEGRLCYSSWETQEGQKRSKVDVTVERFLNLTPREQQAKPAPQEAVSEDIPF